MAMELGDQLRHAREASGFSFTDLSARTKIPVRALQALEAEAFERLPPGVFRRAYLRTVASAVGLDAEACVHAYTDRWEPPPPPEPERRLSSWSDNRLRALVAVGIVAVALAAIPIVTALWRARTVAGASDQHAVASAGVTAPQPAPAPPATPPQPLRMEIQTTNRCWIFATADDVTVVRHLFGAGETVQVDARSKIVLHLGDAGAVTYTINGAPGRPLGQRGDVITVRITPATYARLLAAGTGAQVPAK